MSRRVQGRKREKRKERIKKTSCSRFRPSDAPIPIWSCSVIVLRGIENPSHEPQMLSLALPIIGNMNRNRAIGKLPVTWLHTCGTWRRKTLNPNTVILCLGPACIGVNPSLVQAREIRFEFAFSRRPGGYPMSPCCRISQPGPYVTRVHYAPVRQENRA